jgi:hypothetical protein
MVTPRAKAQQGLGLIKEAMLDLLRQHPDGLHHVDIARMLEIEMGYLGGRQNYASQIILHQLVYAGEVEKVRENRNAIFRLNKPLSKGS